MKTLECIIFNVDHGFCSFIKSPNDYGLLIDCGSREYFSPIKWIKGNYNIGNANIKYFERRRIAEFYLTHLHLDHFDDIGSLTDENKPKHFTRDKKIFPFLDKKISVEKDASSKALMQRLKKFSEEYSQDITNIVDWGFEYFDYDKISLKDAEQISPSDDKIINNRSFIISIKYAGMKILFPGDIEVEGWNVALTYPKIREIIKDTDFFIASHHGHKSGFTRKILEYSGIPYLYIVSAKSGDENIDSSYSNSSNSKGFLIEGDEEKSFMVSTRERKKSIKIVISETGKATVSLIDTPDNLNENQKRILMRRTKRLIKNWNLSREN